MRKKEMSAAYSHKKYTPQTIMYDFQNFFDVLYELCQTCWHRWIKIIDLIFEVCITHWQTDLEVKLS